MLWRRLVREQLEREARNSGHAHQYTSTCTELGTEGRYVDMWIRRYVDT